MTVRILRGFAAASIVLFALAGCSPAATAGPTPSFEEAYVELAEGVRDDLAGWVEEWDAKGCTPGKAASHATCSFSLGEARFIVLAARIRLEGAGVADAARDPLESAWQASKIAAASSDAFSGAGCTGTTSAVCAPLATQAAFDTLALHDELQEWIP